VSFEAEAPIDLAHPRLSSDIGNGSPNLMVTEHVARADDHDLLLTDEANERGDEKD
jgi:hypothetical protein